MMFFAILAACFLALLPTQSAIAQVDDAGLRIDGDALPSPYFIDLDLVRPIMCETPEGIWGGTGVYISATDLVTAAHVIEEGTCRIGGVPVEVVHLDKARDFAVVRTPLKSDRRITISCAGFREGADYFGVGYARGTDFVMQRFTGTRDKVSSRALAGMAVLRGKGFHGQSGGAMIDDLGRLVGIVSAGPQDGTPWLFSRPLTDTYLCAPQSVDKQRTAS